MNKYKTTLVHDLQKTVDDLKEAITDLEEILSIVTNQDSIESFEGAYCEDCHEQCGRSNAEIFNCMRNKISLTKAIEERYQEKEYAKEYLEEDLEKIIEDLKEKHEEFKKILMTLKDAG
jgi:type II secretory ATPase GspE/PulE/Tfp pilus assembly ATPase PilB-like protein